MNAKDALKMNMGMSQMVFGKYLEDLSDADLMTRATGCNHLAWQLGHLINAETGLLNGIAPGKAPELPAGFTERHSKEAVVVDDPAKFNTKQEYLDLWAKLRAATLKTLDELSEQDLDAPSPERLRNFVPTVGAMFNLIGSHPMMHAGQIAVVRRMLGKPVVI